MFTIALGMSHDSNGADTFIERCVRNVRARLPRAKTEVRIDSAFFNETIVERLHTLGVKFTISVPFERFARLKELVEGRRRWRPMAAGLGYFETRWKPKSWNTRYRFIFIRKTGQMPRQITHPTRPVQAHRVRLRVQGHRDQPENQATQGRSLPRRTWLARGHLLPSSRRIARWTTYRSRRGWETNCTCSPAFSPITLTRELQIRLNPRARGTTAKRAALWCFREIETLRRTLIQRAGRIIRPAGKLILSMNSNQRLERDLRHALATLNAA